MGGALTALAPDFDRAVLGVPGMNYSTLLRRSVDFDALRRGRADRGGSDPLDDLARPVATPTRSASTTTTRTSSSGR